MFRSGLFNPASATVGLFTAESLFRLTCLLIPVCSCLLLHYFFVILFTSGMFLSSPMACRVFRLLLPTSVWFKVSTRYKDLHSNYHLVGLGLVTSSCLLDGTGWVITHTCSPTPVIEPGSSKVDSCTNTMVFRSAENIEITSNTENTDFYAFSSFSITWQWFEASLGSS